MKLTPLASGALAGLLAFSPLAARAQAMSLYGGYPVRFYLGASAGGSVFDDHSDRSAAWLNTLYNSTTTLAPGDFISSYGWQHTGDVGAKLYAGAWLTPNVGIEGGYAWLGSVRWHVDSFNTTGSFSVMDTGKVRPAAWYEALLLGFDAGGIRYYAKGGAYEASTHITDYAFDDYTGALFFAGEEKVHNTGALVGLGLTSEIWPHNAWRLEVEDFLNAGSNLTSQVPPWKGNILLFTVGYTYVF